MNATKVAIVLGLTIMGLMGAMQYMKSNDEASVIKVVSDIGIQNLQERLDSFKEWMQKYNKKYSLAETHQRFLIWNKAVDTVQEHNAKGLSWTLEVNMFADLTNEEFAAIYLGYKHDPNRVRENVEYLDTSNAPSTVDWRKKGAVTGIKDQGQCGSCYTFSSAAALEGLYFIKKGTLISLSEQQQLDCSKSYGNQGCNGGLMDNCFKYVKDKGIQKEADYGYTGTVGTCHYDSSKIVYKNTGYTDVPANDPAQLRAALNKQPVSVAVEADEDAFKLYKTGIITANCGTNLDHGITAVGYGANYWIVKNSWGSSWGESGYVRIAQGTQNNGAGVCGINSSASYPTL